MTNNLKRTPLIGTILTDRHLWVEGSDGDLDAAISNNAEGVNAVEITAGATFTLSDANLYGNFMIELDEAASSPVVADFTLRPPASHTSRGLFMVFNNTAFVCTFDETGQTYPSVVIAPGETVLVHITESYVRKVVSVSSAGSSLGFLQPVRVATVSAGTLATDFENGDTVDGVVLATDDRILIKDQAAGAENGVYTVNASGAPTRVPEFDEDFEVLSGTLVVISEGTQNDQLWMLTTNDPITVDTTALTFTQVSGGGGSSSLVDWKDSVRVATTANITLSGEQTIDGVLTSADRVLVKDQSTAADNGIYVSAAGAWTRATDFDADAEVTANAAVFVEEGTANGDELWVLTTNDPIVVGTTAQTWTQIGAGGSLNVQEGGSSIVAAATALNFAGIDFDITDEGSNVAGVALAPKTVVAESSHFRPPLAADFPTWVNQGSATITDDPTFGMLMKQETSPAVGDSWRLRLKAVPTAPWKATARMIGGGVTSTAGNAVSGHMILSSGTLTTSDFYSFGVRPLSGGTSVIAVMKWDSTTVFNSNAFISAHDNSVGGYEWFEIEDNNTDVIFRVGNNPSEMVELFRETRTTFITPSHLGFGVDDEGDPAYLQVLYYTDDDSPAVSGNGVAHDVGSFFGGNPAINTRLLSFVTTRPWVLPSGLTGSQFDFGTNPGATWTLDIKKNGGAASGTISVSTGGVATPTLASDLAFAVGDLLTIETQGTTDGTVADITMTLLGYRT